MSYLKKISFLKFIAFFAISMGSIVVPTWALSPSPPEPPTIEELVSQSTDVIEGYIERFIFRGDPTDSDEWGREFKTAAPGKSRRLEAYVYVNKILYQNGTTPKISKKSIVNVQITIDKDERDGLIGKNKLFVLVYDRNRYLLKFRESYIAIAAPISTNKRSEIQAEISKIIKKK